MIERIVLTILAIILGRAIGALSLTCLDGGDGMNHDYAHCLDFCDDCPKACFRAQLSRDLENVPIWYPVSWMHFNGTEECKKKEVTE